MVRCAAVWLGLLVLAACGGPMGGRPGRGGSSTHAQVTDMRVGVNVGYDRLVFEFDRAVPHYETLPNQAPPGGGTNFTGTFSGLRVRAAGSYGVQLPARPVIDFPTG